MKIKPGKLKIDAHRSRDAVSDAAAAALQVARFPPGYTAQCNCTASNGKMQPEDCDGLCVYKPDGSEAADFNGREYRLAPGDDGGVVVYCMPGATRDEDRLFELRDALVRLNRLNAEFWRVKE
jgi:hypothetical protein